MDLVAMFNDKHLHIRRLNPFRPEVVQEAMLLFDKGTVTIATDIHQKGLPYNSFAFTAEDLREIANMIENQTD